MRYDEKKPHPALTRHFPLNLIRQLRCHLPLNLIRQLRCHLPLKWKGLRRREISGKGLTALIAVLIAALLIGSGGADELQSRWVLCTTFVNIRARASMNSDTIGRLMCGDELTVDQTLRRGGRWWYHCVDLANESSEGWVCADYCTDSIVTVCDETATVTASGRVAIRVSVNGKRSKWAKPGTELTIIAYSDSWALSTRGYIKMEYLTFDQAQDPEGSEADGPDEIP